MPYDPTFDDIRPYRDEEIPAAMDRIAGSGSFPLLASYVFPDKALPEVRELVRSIHTTSEFQSRVMFHMVRQVIGRTITRFTYSGLEHLSPGERYLFIGNHRDIVLDSCLMQYVLYTHGHETSEITFGSNLMQGQLIIDLGKANKMFRVERPENNLKAFYQSSLHLSRYIRQTLTERKCSVWIAQRNGRTKDGLDRTDQGVMKMFGLSRTDDKVDAMDELHILPVAISYEWEPCDLLKALELYERRRISHHYIKKPGEDLTSILTGITQPKGHVHLAFCPRLTREELSAYTAFTVGDFNRAVAALIDRRIHEAYRLYPTNYVAHDLRYGNSDCRDRYTGEDRAAFIERLCGLKRYEDRLDMETLADIFLGIYSNPVEPIRP